MGTAVYETFIETGHHTYALSARNGSQAVIVNYSLCLLCILGVWIGYLLLPKGLRKYMCNAYPKRYARSPSRISSSSACDEKVSGPLSQYKTTLHNLVESTRERNDERTVSEYLSSSPQTGLELGHHPVSLRDQTYQDAVFSRGQLLEQGTRNKTSLNVSSGDNASDSLSNYDNNSDVIDLNDPKQHRTIIEGKHNNITTSVNDLALGEEEIIFDDKRVTKSQTPKNDTTPSPNHPNSLHTAPSTAVVQSCMSSMKQNPGVRLFAHGTRCQPRKVWIRMDITKDALLWRTERSTTDSPSTAQPVGQSHEIALSDILYVDIGKSTTALKAIPETTVPQGICLSILSKQGSLDLSAKTVLERDAIVSCICLILDDRCIRKPKKASNTGSPFYWRTLYKTVVHHADTGSEVSSNADVSLTL